MAVATPTLNPEALLARAEERRVQANHDRCDRERAELGQYFTPAPVAKLMAELVDPVATGTLRLLDPGAGSGSLASALVSAISTWPVPPARLEATLIETDDRLRSPLVETVADCESMCMGHGINFTGSVRFADFLKSTALALNAGEGPSADLAILNPPYRKIGSNSPERSWARAYGVEVSNIYAAFVAAAVTSLSPGGQMVAITPRSFTNGSYFRRFRQFLLDRMALSKVHVFDSRQTAFRGDGVLQENVIVHAIRRPATTPSRVLISASHGPADQLRTREVDPTAVVDPADPEDFIRLPVDQAQADVAATMASLPAHLEDLGLDVSTGPVVDFRVREHLQTEIGPGAVPLLYPGAVRPPGVTWPPTNPRKPTAICALGDAEKWLIPDGNYILVRRFSAKEERRRVVAGVLRKGQLGSDRIGLENHVNYFHRRGEGLDVELAIGLTAYLNSPFVDTYIRLFSGHTQVNASDLRALRYPSRTQLRRLGSAPDPDPAAEALLARLADRPETSGR